MYSLEFEDGPLPTEFVFTYETLKLTPAGQSLQVLQVEFDQIFEIDLPFFDTEATFEQQFEVLDDTASEISGEINYQACDDRVCIFRTETFRIALDGSKLKEEELALSEKDLARSAALTLDLKNKYRKKDKV